MKFTYEQLEDCWVASYDDLDVKVVASTKETATEVLLAALDRVLCMLIAHYGQLLGEARQAQETMGWTQGKELN